MSNRYLTPGEATRQASETAQDFTRYAIRSLREISGFTDQRISDDEILKRHPQIIAAMVQAAASDYQAWVLNMAAERLAQAIERGDDEKPF